MKHIRSFEIARKIIDGRASDEPAFSDAKIPEYATKRSAGADFFCAEEITINPKEIGLAHTGIKANMGENEVLLLYNRSSNPLKLGLMLANSVGVIDADYYNNPDNDGEIMFAFYNFTDKPVTIKAGDKLGQGVFTKYSRPVQGLRIKLVDRVSGFGSTDRQ